MGFFSPSTSSRQQHRHSSNGSSSKSRGHHSGHASSSGSGALSVAQMCDGQVEGEGQNEGQNEGQVEGAPSGPGDAHYYEPYYFGGNAHQGSNFDPYNNTLGTMHGAADEAAAETAAETAAEADTSDDHCYPSSLTSSVQAHIYEAGLQFHALQRSPPAARRGHAGSGSSSSSGADNNGAGHDYGGSSLFGSKLYALPNDDTEQNRDDMKHAMATVLMKGNLFYAPVHDRLAAGGTVYDLGTGSGIWAIELAQMFPASMVRGVDLSPIQPNYVPDNVYFAVDDFEDDWPHPPHAFDFVHMRFSLWAVDDRAALLARIFRHLKPGGYVEFQELVPRMCCDDGTLPPPAVAANALRDFVRYVGLGLRQSRQLTGGDLFVESEGEGIESIPHLADELQAAGFHGIQTAAHKCPMGAWPKTEAMRRCGRLLRQAMLEGLRGWACRPLGETAGGLGWTQTQIEIFLIDVRKAIVDKTVHAYFPMQVTYAQKPMQ